MKYKQVWTLLAALGLLLLNHVHLMLDVNEVDDDG
jgi:hypothetical protein